MFLLLKSQKRAPRLRNCHASVWGSPAFPVSLLRMIFFPCFSEVVIRAFVTVQAPPSTVPSLRASVLFLSLHLYGCPPGLPSSSLASLCQPMTSCYDVLEFSQSYAVMNNIDCWVLSVTSVSPSYSVFSCFAWFQDDFIFFPSSLLQFCILLWLTISTVPILHVFAIIVKYLCFCMIVRGKESPFFLAFLLLPQISLLVRLSLCMQLLLVRMLCFPW